MKGIGFQRAALAAAAIAAVASSASAQTTCVPPPAMPVLKVGPPPSLPPGVPAVCQRAIAAVACSTPQAKAYRQEVAARAAAIAGLLNALAEWQKAADTYVACEQKALG